MQHVILARDRRKKKARIKVVIFLMALISLAIGIALAFKNQPAINATSQTQFVALNEQIIEKNSTTEIANAVVRALENHTIKNHQTSSTVLQKDTEEEVVANNTTDVVQPTTEPNNTVDNRDDENEEDVLIEDQNATSYDDNLGEDDEVEDEQGTLKAKEKVQQEQLPEEVEKVIQDVVDVADEALRIQDQFSYTVERGDKLKDVLEQSGLGASVAKSMIKKYPELANLEAGQQFYWVLDNLGELEYMNWLVSEKEERIYDRQENGKWAFKKVEKTGEWRQDVVRGLINGNFASSLREVGLSDRQISQLSVGLQSQIATNKLGKGDRFAILVKREYINGTVTDVGNVEGIVILSGKKRYYAIQGDNGRYYSNHGETLSRGFARFPLLSTPRVSSPYNPRRLHPITKRVRPHNGVDFALPIGTPIIAPSDGVVEHIAYQARGAGKYIKVRHGHISTVYMHLSKTLVKVGQTVKKGERIALSGNTGGSTGAHLHYEFHINGRPVNPMTVKLPGSNSGMADKERQSFLKRAKAVEAKLKL